MDLEKAIKRVEHWLHHMEDHIGDYENFAGFLKDLGNQDAAKEVMRVADLEKEAKACLEKALKALKAGS